MDLRATVDHIKKLAQLVTLTSAIEDVAVGRTSFRDPTARLALDYFAGILRSEWKLNRSGSPIERRLSRAPAALKLEAMRRGIIVALALGRQDPQRVRIGRSWVKNAGGKVLAGTVPSLQDAWTDEVFWAWLKDHAIAEARAWLIDTLGLSAEDVMADETSEDAVPLHSERLEHLLDGRHDLHRLQALATPRQRQILAELLRQAEGGKKPSLKRAADQLHLEPTTVRVQMARFRARAEATLGHDRIPGPEWLRHELDRIPVIPRRGPEIGHELAQLGVHIRPRTGRHRLGGRK